jgi:hypothetical protein
MRTADRMAAIFLLVLLTAGSAALWIGIPILCLWVASKMADNLGEHFVIALPLTLVGMILWALLLSWLNGLYLRVTGIVARMEEDAEQGWMPRRLRGPLEPLLVVWFVIAVVGLTIWFFFFAENPPRQVI